MVHRLHAILGLVMIDADRLGVELEQVDDRRAEEAHVGRREAHVRRVALLEQHLDLEVPGVGRQCMDAQAAKIDEQEFFAEREVFEQQLIARESNIRLRPQTFIGRETRRFEPRVADRRRRAIAHFGHAQRYRLRLPRQREV